MEPEQEVKQSQEANTQVVEKPGGLAAPAQPPLPLAEVKRWWVIEVWHESRESFKAVMEHAFLFTVVFLILVGVHYLIEHSSLPPNRKEVLEGLDFWGIVGVLAIFAISLMIKLVVLTLGRSNKNGE